MRPINRRSIRISSILHESHNRPIFPFPIFKITISTVHIKRITHLTRHNHRYRLAHAARRVQLEEPEDLADARVDTAFRHDAQTSLRIARYELTKVMHPGRFVDHLVVPYITITLEQQKNHA